MTTGSGSGSGSPQALRPLAEWQESPGRISVPEICFGLKPGAVDLQSIRSVRHGASWNQVRRELRCVQGYLGCLTRKIGGDLFDGLSWTIGVGDPYRGAGDGKMVDDRDHMDLKASVAGKVRWNRKIRDDS